ncbi:MAG: type IV pilus twitching motility protein PilT, partial [Polyangiaceae bacterium]
GDLVPLPFRALAESETRRFLMEILTPEQQALFSRQREIDVAYVLAGVGRFRVNVFTQSRGVGAVFRIIPARMPTIEELRLPEAVRKLALAGHGLVLIAGPTGSGKSTTLAAIVHEVNRTSKRHIITVEDPVEFVHEPIEGIVTQRQVGRDVESFASALRSALRESPDMLVVGEIRDYETLSLALSAAETGVIVFGTLHTNSAAKAVDRIIDICPEEVQDQVRGLVSVLLNGVIAQHLCKRASGDGRMAVSEVLLQSYAVANMIRENKVYQLDALLQSGELMRGGTQSLDSCIFNYVKEGVILAEEGLRVANSPDVLKRLLAELPDGG